MHATEVAPLLGPWLAHGFSIDQLLVVLRAQCAPRVTLDNLPCTMGGALGEASASKRSRGELLVAVCDADGVWLVGGATELGVPIDEPLNEAHPHAALLQRIVSDHLRTLRSAVIVYAADKRCAPHDVVAIAHIQTDARGWIVRPSIGLRSEYAARCRSRGLTNIAARLAVAPASDAFLVALRSPDGIAGVFEVPICEHTTTGRAS